MDQDNPGGLGCCPFDYDDLLEEERTGCFTLIIVVCIASLPHGAVGCSVVCVAFPDHTHFFVTPIFFFFFFFFLHRLSFVCR